MLFCDNMVENNFTHEKLDSLMNSPKYQELFESKPAVINYLKALDELITPMDKFDNLYQDFMDKFEVQSIRIENARVKISDNVTGKILPDKVEILNKTCYDMNNVIREFNDVISNLNKKLYNFYNFDELSFSEIEYYTQYFNIDIYIHEMIENYSGNIYLLNVKISGLNVRINPLRVLDTDLINSFFNAPKVERAFYISHVNYIHADVNPADYLKKIIRRYGNISKHTRPPRSIYFINEDPAKYISLLPSFNLTLANKVIEARRRGIVFRDMDELLDYLSFKPCMGLILKDYISFKKSEYDMWIRFLKNKNKDSSFSEGDDILINVTGMYYYHYFKPFKKGTILNLIPEPENKHDSDAIRVETDFYGKVGYVANGPNTLISPTKSASEIKDIIKNPQKAEVLFIYDRRYVISKLIFD